MPDLTIQNARTCIDNVSIEKKVGDYHVSYGHTMGWICNCKGYKFHKQDCKHIKQAQTEQCTWNWEAFTGTDGVPTHDDKCPECGKEIRVIRVGV